MIKGFIDLWVDASDIDCIARVAEELGYTAIVLEDHGFKWRIERRRVLLVKKRTIVASSEQELRRRLRGIKVSYPIVSVVPESIQVARFAARDKRVDTVVLTPSSLEYIDRTQAYMMKQFNKPIEVPLRQFIGSNNRVKAMIYRRIMMLYSIGAPVVYSSGARCWNQLIHPAGIISLVKTLTGVDKRLIAYSISGLCREILVRNGVRL